MKMIKWALLLAIVLGLSLVLAGCPGDGSMKKSSGSQAPARSY